MPNAQFAKFGGMFKKFKFHHRPVLSLAPSQRFAQAPLLERQGQVQRQEPGEAEVAAGTILKLINKTLMSQEIGHS